MLRFCLRTTLFLAFAFCYFQCKTPLTDTFKFHAGDPFISSMVESQFFEINADSGQVIEGALGTRIVCPIGCFLDKNGKTIKGKIRIELAEALQNDAMVRSNLTTQSGGKPLETGGMLYCNVTSNGAQVAINPITPVSIDIPTPNKQEDMQVYKGTRDPEGNMDWIDPQPIEKFITPVDIFTLDFLPKGFQAEVERSMPFGKYKTATKELADSLYYSLSVGVLPVESSEYIHTDLNEAYYNTQKKVVDGKYTDDSYGHSGEHTFQDSLAESVTKPEIDPAMIMALYSEPFQNTLIATREFEKRLQTVFKTCSNKALEAYVNNLDQPLWQLDEMAAKVAEEKGEIESAEQFKKYAAQKLTRVKNGGERANLLKKYLKERVSAIKKELAEKKQELRNALDKKNESARKVANEYKALLFKRETYRMETYGFEWSATGWLNVDKGIIPKDWDAQPLEILVDNSNEFDRVYTYIIYESINSLYRLNTDDNNRFYVGNEKDPRMLMPKKKTAAIISIGYKNDQIAMATSTITTGEDTKASLHLELSDKAKMKAVLNQYNNYGKENQIEQDLVFMEQLYVEKQRQLALQKEVDVMYRLYYIAFPCALLEEGSILFDTKCGLCHNKNMCDKLIGPALYTARDSWKDDNGLYAFIRNSQKSIADGHPRAVEQWNTWKPILMTSFEQLNSKDMAALLMYISDHNCTNPPQTQ
jgi:hypothetical protein